MRFLAADSLAGRGTGSREYRLAATYVAEQFAAAGAKPGFKGGWFQDVPLRHELVDNAGSGLEIVTGTASARFEPGRDFVFTDNTWDSANVNTAVVYVRYGVTAPVTSPTYTLVHEYGAARSVVYHLDLFRLVDESALTNIGWDEIVGAAALVLVEWPERAGSRLPADVVTVSLARCAGDDDRRSLTEG